MVENWVDDSWHTVFNGCVTVIHLSFWHGWEKEGTAQPCIENIKVANVTWHELIHVDYYHTFKSSDMNGVKGQLATLCAGMQPNL